MSTPVIRALKEKYPQASISMLTIPLTAPIAQLNPYIDKVLIYDKKGQHSGVLGAWKVVNTIKKEKFDMDFDKKKIKLDTIKELGKHIAEIKLHPEVKAEVKIDVVEE